MARRAIAKIRKYQYLLLIITFGALFLGSTGNWKLYGEPAKEFGKVIGEAFGLSFAEERTEARQQAKYEEPVLAGEVAEDADGSGNEDFREQDAADELSIEKEVVWQQVEDEYFRDACFIGDSRVVGMWEYGNLEDVATFYASTGLTVYRLFDSKIVPTEIPRKKITVEEALGGRQFAKIYLMVGINEMGIGTIERFAETYEEAVQHIRELQPDAIIYLQSIMKVTKARSAQGDYIFNEGIDQRNDLIMQMADNEHIFYLDVNEAVCDESGGMNPAYTTDGVHLKAKYVPLWKDYLKSHAVQLQ
ncbi:MAG: acylhydrolase [Lachnospiraceae bacterium]|nr:acylhydrolase [Lachnospiraceae bacterium]